MTSLGLGLTMAISPTTTVGTVSLPSAIERTTAAASGSVQMFTSRVGSRRRRSALRRRQQNGQPGRQ